MGEMYFRARGAEYNEILSIVTFPDMRDIYLLSIPPPRHRKESMSFVRNIYPITCVG